MNPLERAPHRHTGEDGRIYDAIEFRPVQAYGGPRPARGRWVRDPRTGWDFEYEFINGDDP